MDKSKFEDTELMLDVAIMALAAECKHNPTDDECKDKCCAACIREKVADKAEALRKLRNAD